MKLILTAISEPKRIQSIKAVRAATGLGLKEAKYAVDALTSDEAFHGGQRPHGFTDHQIDETVIATGLSQAAAANALAILRSEGYADGRIDTESSDADRIEEVLKYAEAVRLARETELPVSEIVARLVTV